MIASESTLRSIALDQPATIRVFERFHLDYCCGGNRPLAAACAEKGIAVEEVLAGLEQALAGTDVQAGLIQSSLAGLIHHIVHTHHEYIRAELPRLGAMAERVATKHGPLHPEATLIQRDLAKLGDELLFHLNKEERILFPYIEGLERSREQNTAPPSSCFGTVESPIQQMVNEHEGAAALLNEMRAYANGFTPWAGACPTTVGLFHGLAEFERDLHRHVHLENNLLFPRAIAIEKEMPAAK